MSLRWRILATFIIVILLTVLISIGVAYWTAQQNLAEFKEEIGGFEADSLAGILSQEYSQTGGWETLEFALIESGYLYDEEVLAELYGLDQEELIEIFFEEPSHAIVADATGQILIDGFGEFEPGSSAAGIDGARAPIIDLRTNQPVGELIIDIDPNAFTDESAGFLADTLFTTALGGLITAIFATMLAAWFSKQVTAPVTALTQATQKIAEQDDEVQLLPVTSNDELGQMSQAFNQMTTSLQTQRSLRKRLIDDISHELNTPLSVIQLEAKGLKDGLQTAEEASGQIIQEVEMLRNLVHDLNWLAETDSGELRLNLEPSDLIEVLSAEVERWQNQAQSQKINLILKPLPHLPKILLDKMRISQVLGNLIRNGIQHTEAGGKIEIGATFGPQSVVITVADTGIGIDPAELPHIFDRFYRTDRSRSRVTGGRGLGLAITRAIVEAHGGTLNMTSAGIGKGAEATFELPVTGDQSASQK